MTDNNPQSSESNKQYQDIINQYRRVVNSLPSDAKPAQPIQSPSPSPTPSSITSSNSTPTPTTNLVLPNPIVTPLPPLSQPLPEVTQTAISPSPSRQSRFFNFFKFTFFASFFIFVGVAAAIVYTFTSGQQSTTISQNQTTVDPTPSTVTASCELNGSSYQVGQSFSAADGCNTCSCLDDLTISCTELDCSATPSITTSDIDVKDWKKYEDKALGFTFQYPKSLVFTNYPDSPDSGVFDVSKMVFPENSEGPITPLSIHVIDSLVEERVTDLKRTYQYKSYADKLLPNISTSAKKIGGIVEAESYITGKLDLHLLVSLDGGKIVDINFIGINDSLLTEADFNQILSTFKFTD